MIFWKTKQLRNDIITGSISEKEKMKYLLATMITYAIAGELPGSDANDGYYLAEFLSVVFVTIIGIIFCYDANNKGDGKNFIERFICISWPITIKITVFAIVFFIIVSVANYDLALDYNNSSIGIGFLIVMETIYFWRIKVHMEYVSKGQLP
jgi:hypothetical protein